MSLIAIRLDALKAASSNEDNFFTYYNNAKLNFIPVITEEERSVFVLTGPQVSGIVLIGNDYKLKYDESNNYISKEKIHNTLLQFPYASNDSTSTISWTNHSHIKTEIISSTDICTLLLYKKFIEWNQHFVISESTVSIFDLEKESLITMSREAWEKLQD